MMTNYHLVSEYDLFVPMFEKYKMLQIHYEFLSWSLTTMIKYDKHNVEQRQNSKQFSDD